MPRFPATSLKQLKSVSVGHLRERYFPEIDSPRVTERTPELCAAQYGDVLAETCTATKLESCRNGLIATDGNKCGCPAGQYVTGTGELSLLSDTR